MDATFVLSSNVVPQNMACNGTDWLRLEEAVRRLVRGEGGLRRYDHAYVVSGPLFLPTKSIAASAMDVGSEAADADAAGSGAADARADVVSYARIGPRRVAVPTHLFKAVLAEDEGAGGRRCVAAFVVPNRAMPEERPLTEFQVEIGALESMSGLRLFGGGLEGARDLCRADGGRWCAYGDARSGLVRMWRRLAAVEGAASPAEADLALAEARRRGDLEGSPRRARLFERAHARAVARVGTRPAQASRASVERAGGGQTEGARRSSARGG
jgi:hypothetical protein